MESVKNFLIRSKQVRAARGGRSNSSHWLDIQKGLWTRPIHTGPHSSVWPLEEVEALNAAYIAGKSRDEIKELVAQLHAKRQGG
jgi:Predicted transcriptional regulator